MSSISDVELSLFVEQLHIWKNQPSSSSSNLGTDKELSN